MGNNKLMIYSNKAYVADNVDYVPILYPFWGKTPCNTEDPSNCMFDDYINDANSLFDLSPLKEADISILPLDWEPTLRLEQEDLAAKFFNEVKESKKPTVSFFSGDCSHLPIPINTNLVFRHSLYRSTREVNSFAFPAWSEDFVKEYSNKQLPIRKKSAKPVVGFCGYAVKRNLKTYAKHILYRSKRLILKDKSSIPPYNIGHVLRLWILLKLSKSSLVETNFVRRSHPVFFTDSSYAFKEMMRREYVQNIFESDYVLCCRGSGNYSYRFYETLSCGRIPVFINTDCVLPYDFEINWKDYCVWVEESELSEIDKKIADFHQSISPRQFIEIQFECRKIWESMISPKGFFANLHRHFNFIDI